MWLNFMWIRSILSTICMINMLMSPVRWRCTIHWLTGSQLLGLPDFPLRQIPCLLLNLQKCVRFEMNRALPLILKWKETSRNMVMMMTGWMISQWRLYPIFQQSWRNIRCTGMASIPFLHWLLHVMSCLERKPGPHRMVVNPENLLHRELIRCTEGIWMVRWHRWIQ